MADINLRVGFDTSPAWQHSELSRLASILACFSPPKRPQHHSSRCSVMGAVAQFVLRRDQGNGNQLGVGFGLLQERDALFRTTATGAFEEPENTRSGFLTLSGTRSLTPSIKLQLSYTEAWADPSKVEYGFLGNWSLVRSNAVALSLIAEDVLADGDRLGFMIGQPLRVYRARADLTLPVSRDLEGFVQHETRRIDVTPDGREIDLQVAYQIRLSDMLTASSFTTLMLNPGHDNDEDASASAGVKLKLRF